MPVRFDSRPLVHRRPVTATLRLTRLIGATDIWPHIFHLFSVIFSSVLVRNLTNELVLTQRGEQGLPWVYLSTSLFSGIGLAILGRYAQRLSPKTFGLGVSVAAMLLTVVAGVIGHANAWAAMSSYVLSEFIWASALLCFGLCLGANLEANDARRTAAKIGAGGIAGGLAAGALLCFSESIGSRNLFMVGAVGALVPILPLRHMPMHRFSPKRQSSRNAASHFSIQLHRYGRWLMVVTLLMTLGTTLIDFQYRSLAAQAFDGDAINAFFGRVTIWAGLITILFQLLLLDTLLKNWGLFPTAMVMPAVLIGCSLLFGLAPGVMSLALLKLMDSGTNMSVQQATGGLLLAPLGVRARALWQSRLDGLAKRGGQALAGAALLAWMFWVPNNTSDTAEGAIHTSTAIRLVPFVLVLCAAWVLALLRTRSAYIQLLSHLIQRPVSPDPETLAIDGATVHLLEYQLGHVPPARAAVILDLLAIAAHRVPDYKLERLLDQRRHTKDALLVVDYLSTLGDTQALMRLTDSTDTFVAGQAILALREIAPNQSDAACERILNTNNLAPELLSLISGLRAPWDQDALLRVQRFAQDPESTVRQALAQGLGVCPPTGNPAITHWLETLAQDPDEEVAKLALGYLSEHVSNRTLSIVMKALEHRNLRSAAMKTLANIGRGAVDAIGTRLLTPGTEASIASSLCWVLARIESPRSAPYLRQVMKAGHTMVRLSAVIALTQMMREQKRSNIGLPVEPLNTDELKSPLRDATGYKQLVEFLQQNKQPSSHAKLLRRMLQHRSRASLEMFFRMLSLQYPGETVTHAYHAFFGTQASSRQLALELLDTTLDQSLRQPLTLAAMPATMTQDQLPTVLGRLPWHHDPLLISMTQVQWPDLDLSALMSSHPETTMHTQTLDPQTIQKLLELHAASLFQYATADDLIELARMSAPKRFESGTMIYQEGARPDALYVLRSGQVALNTSELNMHHPPQPVVEGEAFGYLSILDGLPRPATATAQTSIEVYEIAAHELEHLLTDRPLLMHSLLRALSARLRQAGLRH